MDKELSAVFIKIQDRLAGIQRHLAVTSAICLCPPESGVHVLKGVWTETDYLKEYCEALAPRLAAACDRTRIVAGRHLRSARRKPYGLSDRQQKPGTDLEAVLEKRLYAKWRDTDLGGTAPLWNRIIQNQVPMKASQKSETGLKAIDLLATSKDGTPVIIELKVWHKHCDTPLHALLEATSYACVLQADWPAFCVEWKTAVGRLGITPELPPSLSRCHLVVAATPDYWAFWENEQRASMVQSRQAFQILLQEYSAIGFPVRFASINQDDLQVSEYFFPVRSRH